LEGSEKLEPEGGGERREPGFQRNMASAHECKRKSSRVRKKVEKKRGK